MMRYAILFACLTAVAPGADYAITVRSVYDGDTVIADVALPPTEMRAPGKRLAVAVTLLGERIRIEGIDAPELHTDDGKRARDMLANSLPAGTRGILRTRTREIEKFGRPFGRIIIDGSDAGERLVASGMARRWDGKGKRP